MSNYNLQINWSGKDALSDSDPDKVISGDDMSTEFNAVKTAVNSKADLAGSSGQAFAASTLTATTVTGTTVNATNLNVGGSAVTSTAAELNILDGKSFVDEDDMSSDSATGIPSQQSVKAYVDNNAYSTTDLKTDMNASGNAPLFGVRAWANFNGTGTPSLNGSGNIASITDNGTGNYTLNFTSTMPNANYAVIGTTADANKEFSVRIGTKATSSVQIRIYREETETYYDADNINIIVVG